MKILLIVGALILAGAAAWFFLGRPQADHHGQAFRGLERAEIAALVDKPADHLKKDLRIEGVLTRQCPATGCWFFLRGEGNKDLKVEMGDTTPKLPTRVGKRATVEGRLIKYGEGYEFVGVAVEFH